jgi:uncharacterized protein YpmS
MAAKKKKWYTKWWVWVLIIFFGLPMLIGLIVAILSPSENPNLSSETNTANNTIETS